MLLSSLPSVPSADAGHEGSLISGARAAHPSAPDPPEPSQAAHGVDAILVFVKDGEPYYSFRGHDPSIPKPVNAPLTWHWFSGSPATPNLANPAAILEDTGGTKQVRVAWSREGYALAVWDAESVYGSRDCDGDGTAETPLRKTVIRYSLFRDETGAWGAPQTASAPAEDGLSHVSYLFPSIAVDGSGNGLLTFAFHQIDACVGTPARQIRYAVWRGDLSAFDPDALVAPSAFPFPVDPTALAFSAQAAPEGATTRQTAIVAWWEFLGNEGKTCFDSEGNPFDLSVPLYWPVYKVWDGNAWGPESEIPGRRLPPGRWESLVARGGLAASPDRHGNVAVAFPVETTTNPCPPASPGVEVWRARYHATGGTWDGATFAGNGKAPGVAYRTTQSGDQAYLAYQGPDDLNPDVRLNALNGSDIGAEAVIAPATTRTPAAVAMAHGQFLIVWVSGTGPLRFLQRSEATQTDAVGDVGATGASPFLAGRTGSPQLPHAEWSYLAYFAADNNLHPDIARDDVNEIRTVGSTALVNAVLFVDPLNTWDGTAWGAAPGGPAPPNPWANGNARYAYVKRNDHTILRDLGEVNSGAPATLETFLAWALEHYPAARTVLDLADHGEGWKRNCQDWRQGNTWLNTTTLATAFAAIKGTSTFRFDVLTFSACFMAMAEVDYMARDHASFRVATQEIMPNPGPNYVGIFRNLTMNPFRTSAQTATNFVSVFQSAYQGGTGLSSRETVSAVDLSQVNVLAQQVGEFAAALRTWLNDPAATGAERAARKANIQNQRDAAEEFPHQQWQTEGGAPPEGYRDLDHFAELVRNSLLPDNPNTNLDNTVRTAADNVRTARAAAVIANFADAGHPNGRGISIWIEDSGAMLAALRPAYDMMPWGQGVPGWAPFLENQTASREIQLTLEVSPAPSTGSVLLQVATPAGQVVGIPTFTGRCGGLCGTNLTGAQCVELMNPGTVVVLPITVTEFTWFVKGGFLVETVGFTLRIQVMETNETTHRTTPLTTLTLTGSVAPGSTTSGPYVLDDEPPITTILVSGTMGDPGWWLSDVTVNLTTSDEGNAGADTVFYRVDNGPWRTYTATFPVTGNGTHTVDYYGVDVLGNAEPVQTEPIGIDTVAPATTHSLGGTTGGAGWWRSAVTVTLTASDATSGVSRIQYRIDGGTLRTYAAPFDLTADGMHTVKYFARDVAGNVEETRVVTVDIDTTSPTTTASYAGTAGWSGWWRSPVTVTLTARDGDSGPSIISYGVDGAPLRTYAAPFTIAGDGTHTLEYYAVDAAGNVEGTTRETVLIDTTLPEISHTSSCSLPGDVGWCRGTVTVTVTADDAASGIDGIGYILDGQPETGYEGPILIASDGYHKLLLVAGDRAGNVRTTDVFVDVDGSPPTTTPSVAGRLGSNGWYTSPVRVTLTVADTTSPVVFTQYSVDDGPFETYVGRFDVFGDGAHAIRFRSLDEAGNMEAERTVILQIDTTPPRTTITVDGTAGNAGWWRSAVTVTLTATDEESGVAAIHYRLDDGQLTDYAAPFSIPLDGVHTLEVFAEDNAGSLEPLQTVEVKIDRVVPTLIVTEPVVGSNVTAGDVTIRWSGTDTTSGLGPCMVSLDGGTSAVATGSSHTLRISEGRHTVIVTCEDAAGNSASQSTTFDVREAPPPPTPPGGLHPAIAVAIISAVVLGLGVLALLRGRKKKEPEEG